MYKFLFFPRHAKMHNPTCAETSVDPTAGLNISEKKKILPLQDAALNRLFSFVVTLYVVVFIYSTEEIRQQRKGKRKKEVGRPIAAPANQLGR
jgi:hypothetical protein